MATTGKPTHQTPHDPNHPGGKPVPTHDTEAEQTREANESAAANAHKESARDHMVDIGRGNQQAGRQGQ